ncbi:MAG: adenylyl-sulfate kinase [Nitrososphaerales archaeon]
MMEQKKVAQKPEGFTIWMTGLPGSGKSTLAVLLKKKYEEEYDRFVEVLDGDEVRKGLSRDLGLSREDREEHARRVSYLAKVLARNGVISVVALISPYKSSRDNAREVIGKERFIEVYVKASLAACETRDPKGLYAKARKGEITNMTGIQDPYEMPESPDIVIDTEKNSKEESVKIITDALKSLGHSPEL